MIDQDVYRFPEAFIAYLSQYISERKRRLIDQHLSFRTKYLTVVLEDIHKSHNASAVLRTCECFGVQDLHIIEKEHEYNLHPHISGGAARWLDLVHYRESEGSGTEACFDELKAQGYQMLVTTLDRNSLSFDQIDLDRPSAIVFGTEYYGVSESAVQLADQTIHIPMFGFTDSLNLSVSAGIILQSYRHRIHEKPHIWQLDVEHKQRIKLDWYMNSVRNIDQHIKSFLSNPPNIR